ncbi:MAG: hypothetical protein C6W56_09525 [Caldibacillus debilis]|nr:MAG: hypothetical protein C6W56_09525 [Caldibacillus debilis]
MNAAENQAGVVFMGEIRFLHRGTLRTPTFRLDRDREKGPEPAAFLPFLKPPSAVSSAGK